MLLFFSDPFHQGLWLQYAEDHRWHHHRRPDGSDQLPACRWRLGAVRGAVAQIDPGRIRTL